MKKTLLVLMYSSFVLLFSSGNITFATPSEDTFVKIAPRLESYVKKNKVETIANTIKLLTPKIEQLSGEKKELGTLIVMYIQQLNNQRSVSNKLKNGDIVAVDYTLTISEGKNKVVKDTSIKSIAERNNISQVGRTYEPLTFTLGMEQMIPGFEKAISTMYIGEKRSILLLPKDGYGEKNMGMIEHIEKSMFTDAGIEPIVGETFNFSFVPGKVLSIEERSVTMDFNHPLAGKLLYFDVETIKIIKINKLSI